MRSHPEKIVGSKAFSYFLQLSKTMNYTQTAKMLGITQPALTQQIKRLEKSVDTTLFYSVGKQLYLTEAGKTMKKMIEDIYEIVVDATDQIQLESSESSGKITIGISASIEDKVFTDFIIHHYQKYPNVHIDLLVVGYEELWQLMSQSKLDLAILYLPNELPDLLQNMEIIPIAQDEIVFLYPPDLLESKDSISYEQSILFPWVSYPYSYFVSKVVLEAFKKEQVNLPESVAYFTKPSQLLKFSNEVNVCTALPKSFYIAHKEEVRLESSSFYPPIPMSLSFVLQKEKYKVPRIVHFLDEFHTYLQGKDYLTYLY